MPMYRKSQNALQFLSINSRFLYSFFIWRIKSHPIEVHHRKDGRIEEINHALDSRIARELFSETAHDIPGNGSCSLLYVPFCKENGIKKPKPKVWYTLLHLFWKGKSLMSQLFQSVWQERMSYTLSLGISEVFLYHWKHSLVSCH